MINKPIDQITEGDLNDLNSGDREGGADVIVINHQMAEMFWPGGRGLGLPTIEGGWSHWTLKQ